MSLSKEKRNELQKIQNDILRICNGTRVVDRVSTEILHYGKIIIIESKTTKTAIDFDVYLFERRQCTTYTCP